MADKDTTSRSDSHLSQGGAAKDLNISGPVPQRTTARLGKDPVRAPNGTGKSGVGKGLSTW